MFDITSLNTEQKVLFDQLTAAERKFLKSQDDMIVADAISAMEEIEELVSQVAMATGGDEEEILGAAEEIAEKVRWGDIVDRWREKEMMLLTVKRDGP